MPRAGTALHRPTAFSGRSPRGPWSAALARVWGSLIQQVVHVLRGSVTLLVVVGLFWTATNFATVEGTELARAFPGQVATLPSVEVDSAQPLDIVAPGVEVSCLGKARDGAITTAACATAED